MELKKHGNKVHVEIKQQKRLMVTSVPQSFSTGLVYFCILISTLFPCFFQLHFYMQKFLYRKFSLIVYMYMYTSVLLCHNTVQRETFEKEIFSRKCENKRFHGENFHGSMIEWDACAHVHLCAQLQCIAKPIFIMQVIL